MSAGIAALAWIGLAAGAFVLVQVLILLNRVLRPLREIKQNADEILAFGVAIAKNLDDVEEAVRTRELAQALPELVRPVAEKLGAQ